MPGRRPRRRCRPTAPRRSVGGSTRAGRPSRRQDPQRPQRRVRSTRAPCAGRASLSVGARSSASRRARSVRSSPGSVAVTSRRCPIASIAHRRRSHRSVSVGRRVGHLDRRQLDGDRSERREQRRDLRRFGLVIVVDREDEQRLDRDLRRLDAALGVHVAAATGGRSSAKPMSAVIGTEIALPPTPRRIEHEHRDARQHAGVVGRDQRGGRRRRERPGSAGCRRARLAAGRVRDRLDARRSRASGRAAATTTVPTSIADGALAAAGPASAVTRPPGTGARSRTICSTGSVSR